MRWLWSLALWVLAFIRALYDRIIDGIFEYRHRDKKSRPLPPIQSDILLLSATQLAKKIRQRELTSVEVLQTYIDRIKKVNPVINAVVDQMFDSALAEAADVDSALTSHLESISISKRPLLGVPLTVKEAFGVRGMSHTCGITRRAGTRAKDDAEAVRILREAGAIPLVVSNVPECCLWMETFNNVHGRTNNPYDTRRTSGGSSGGEGALVGAGASVIGLASDTAGSIRIPASFNGVFGHKPTPGIISNVGQLPKVSKTIDQKFLTTGPICRYAEDLTLMMRLLVKPDLEAALALDTEVSVKDLKVYYMADNGGGIMETAVSKDVVQAQSKLVRMIGDSGLKVKQVAIEELKHSGPLFAFRFAKLSDDSDQLSVPQMSTDPDHEGFNPVAEFFRLVSGSSDHTLPIVLQGLGEQLGVFLSDRFGINDKYLMPGVFDKLSARLTQLLGEDGVLIYPTHPVPAPYHHQSLFRPYNLSYTAIFNLLGFPSTQVPVGFSKDGLPLGVQLIAGKNMDKNSLGLAKEVEKLMGGWKPQR